jgi:hypothetical protein
VEAFGKMTSHYLGCTVKASFENVFDALSNAYGNIYAKKYGRMNEPSVGFILGEHFFFRASSDAAVLIILRALSPLETKAEIISWAGGTGMLSISYGAHSAFVHEVKNSLLNAGFKVEQEEEVSYFDRDKSQLLRE